MLVDFIFIHLTVHGVDVVRQDVLIFHLLVVNVLFVRATLIRFSSVEEF
jgi:hypothetical protein